MPIAKVIRAAESKIVSLQDAKDYLAIGSNFFDSVIQELIDSAIDLFESHTGLATSAQTIVQTNKITGYNESVVLERWPANSITTFRYNFHGISSDISPSTYYLDADSKPSAIVTRELNCWPMYMVKGLTITTYNAGFAIGEAPQSAKRGILFLVAHWFANREGLGNLTEYPLAYNAAVSANKIWSL